MCEMRSSTSQLPEQEKKGPEREEIKEQRRDPIKAPLRADYLKPHTYFGDKVNGKRSPYGLSPCH